MAQSQPIDILDQRDPLMTPFLVALLVHALIAGSIFYGMFWMKKGENFGDVNPAGGPAYAVSPVHTIPIPQRDAPPNPVANDTKSSVPTPPAKLEVAKQKPPPPAKNAFQIPDKVKYDIQRPQHKQNYTQPAPPNQVYSDTRQAVSNPMYAAQSGGGKVGVGPNSPLGNRYGWYAELIRQRIAQNWQTAGLDSGHQSTPAVVSFSILRDGTIRNPQITQSSGNPNIDNTALRAVYQSNPMPALPPQITESYISAQFTFTLH